MADLAATAAFAGYRLFGQIMRPIVPMIVARRVARGKEDDSRSAERYGIASRERPPGSVVWVHAASVGETNAVLPLVARLVSSGRGVVLTTTTLTSAEIAAPRLPAGAVHQFVPFDIAPFVDRFLDHWRPDVVILTESELWPTIMSRVATAGIPLAVVNATLSDRSYRSWRRVAPIARMLMSRIDLCLAQSEGDGGHFRDLGAASVEVTGNLKFDGPLLEVDPAALSAMKTLFAGRDVWTAASTHPGEEAQIAETHRALQQLQGNALTVIAPRHPQRGDDIRRDLKEAGLRVAQRSRNEPVTTDTDIYLADTLGELGLLYSLSNVVFMGGSLVPIGGHNPIEAARFGVPVLYGPNIEKSEDVYVPIGEAGEIADTAELAHKVAGFLSDPEAARNHGEKLRQSVESHAGALDRTFERIDALLSEASPNG